MSIALLSNGIQCFFFAVVNGGCFRVSEVTTDVSVIIGQDFYDTGIFEF